MFHWMGKLDRYVPFRYAVWLLCTAAALVSGIWWFTQGSGGWPALGFSLLALVGLRDTQFRGQLTQLS